MKIFDGILSSPPSSKPSKIKVIKQPIDKLYISCIDGRAICNGKRTQINQNSYNLGRKSNYLTVFKKSDIFAESAVFQPSTRLGHKAFVQKEILYSDILNSFLILPRLYIIPYNYNFPK